MTRERRTHLLILALVPVVVFGAVRCADNSATAPATSASPLAHDPAVEARYARLHSENDWVGRYHNDALSYVFADLNRLPAQARGRRSVCEAARRSYAEFHRSRRGSNVPASVDAQFEQFCAGGSSPAAARAAGLALTPAEARKEISLDAQGLMDQIEYAIEPSASYDDLAASVNAIEASAAATLSYDEAAAVVTVGSIALNSASYWANNLPSWIPYTSSADYPTLLSTRVVPPSRSGISPAFSYGNDGGSFSSWAAGVWNDAKRAAKRAAGGDAHAAIKAVVGAGLAEAPIIYDVVIGAAAAGSIMAVLQM